MLVILGFLFVALVLLILLFITKSKKTQVHFYVKPEGEVDLVYTNDVSGCRITIEIDGVCFFSDIYLTEQDAFEDCRRLNKVFKRRI